MIVVVGTLAWGGPATPRPTGRGAAVALAAAADGAAVEVVGRVGDDDPGDELLIALARAGVGHAAVLRDPARPTAILAAPAMAEPPLAELDAALAPLSGGLGEEGASRAAPAVAVGLDGRRAPVLEAEDVALALRYLADFGVLVVTEDAPAAVLPVALEGARYAGARLVLLVADGAEPPRGTPRDTTVLAAPDEDEGDRFATLVGAYAALLDGGAEPAEAFAAAVARHGWEGIPG